MEIITEALKAGQGTLSEYESKKLLGAYNIPVTQEILAENKDAALEAAKKLGFPVVLKACCYEFFLTE